MEEQMPELEPSAILKSLKIETPKPEMKIKKEKIFDDSQDIFYRPKIEFMASKMKVGPTKLIKKQSKNEDVNHKNIFDVSFEEEKVDVKKRK